MKVCPDFEVRPPGLFLEFPAGRLSVSLSGLKASSRRGPVPSDFYVVIAEEKGGSVRVDHNGTRSKPVTTFPCG
jgi:hypothetical protein